MSDMALEQARRRVDEEEKRAPSGSARSSARSRACSAAAWSPSASRVIASSRKASTSQRRGGRGARRRDAQTGANATTLTAGREPVMSSSVWIINLVGLGVVLEADLGRRKVTWPRLARPVIVAGAIVIYYLTRTPAATRGGGLVFELVLAALGIVLGLAAGLMFRVFRHQGIPWSQAGIGYALLWIVVIAARIGFAEATSDALIFMAVGMLLTHGHLAHKRNGATRPPPAGPPGGSQTTARRVSTRGWLPSIRG
jgi:hypothetical protein